MGIGAFARYCAGDVREEPEIVGRLRRAYDAFSRGNFDRAMEIAHPDVEFVPAGGQAPLRGAKAFRAWMEPDALEENRIEPREMRVNGDKVLVRAHSWAAAREAASRSEIDAWAVWTVDDDGLVTRVEAFLDHEGRSPRSRRAVGVGDVAGERGDRPAGFHGDA